MNEQRRAPFPWFGGKSRAAAEVWAALGNVDNYVEPFAGSLGVLLGRPGGPGKIETVNDADGLLANVWRSIAWSPDETAEAADWPVSEADLSARHLWLVEHRQEVTDRLCADPHWHDPVLAGWWVWGVCSWIGSDWCSGKGPWGRSEDGCRLVKRAPGGGINRQLPHLGDAGRGINRVKRAPGGGINRQLPHLGSAGQGINRIDAPVRQWMHDLAARLRGVRIVCGDWSRVVTPVCTWRHGLTGVLLDPPYPAGWDHDGAYAGNGSSTAQLWADVTAWAENAGERPDMRVIVCGYDGTWEPPSGWTERTWIARPGYAKDKAEARRERLWCSPACLSPMQPMLFGAP